MTNTEIAQQLASTYPSRVAGKGNRTRPSNLGDIRNAAKIVASELGLTGNDHGLFVVAALRAALGRDDISTAGFGR